jgi:hypothetical protein
MTAKTFTHMMLNVGASLSDEMIEESEKDGINYTRLSGSARKLQTGMGKTDFEWDAYKDEIKISKGGRNELFRKTRADCGREQRNGAAGRQSAPQSRGLCDDRRQPEGEA